ncbi:MAG: hypothetical protein GX624_10470 [Actinobacteria bacterium]|nr:hypothetical protein [Actinomycetota bacterium]
MDRLQAFFDSFFAWLPNLIGAVVILIVAYIVARIVAGIVRRIAARTRVDHHVDTSVVGDYKRSVAPRLSVSNLIAGVVFWFVMGTGILLAVATLQIPLLDSAIGTVVGYLPNVLAAVLILAVGVAIAGAVGAFASRLAGDTMLGKAVGTAVPVVIVAISIAMALVQLQISPPIVIITYAVILGAVGLGLALAFGLGGRAVAADLLRRAYDKTEEGMPQMREEAQLVRDRTESEVQRGKEKLDEKLDEHKEGPGEEDVSSRRAA